MKKIIIAILFTIISMNAFADWKYKYDETQECTYSYYIKDTKDGLFFTSDVEDYVGIIIDDDEFETDEEGYVSVQVEFIYAGGVTVEVEKTFKIDRTDHSSMCCDDTTAKTILRHIKSKGNVRISAATTSGEVFEIVIPKNQKLKWEE